MLENERSFDRLFCDVLPSEQFTLYYNPSFYDDPIFNHSVVSDRIMAGEGLESLSLEALFERISAAAESKNVPPSVFVDGFRKAARTVEIEAIEFGYRISEKMHIMSKELRSEGSTVVEIHPRVRVFETQDYKAWNQVFMESFGIPEYWGGELLAREKKFVKDSITKLLVLVEENIGPPGSACLLLHQSAGQCLGIYCVGTIPSRRSRGLAKVLLQESESIASKQGINLLTLQTVASDGVTPMYQKLGYAVNFERDVLQKE